MKFRLIALACLLAPVAPAQLSNYLGPGILTRGAGTIGTRAGQPVDLRFYADVTGIVDNGIQPLSLDSNGNLAQVGALYGVEAGIGAYGVHEWRQSLLGLDYRGVFRHYSQASFYDGSDHILSLGYTYQKSKRWIFDNRVIAGTFSNYLGSVPALTIAIPTTVNAPTLLLFDSRTYFLEGGMDSTYLLTSRTSFTVGGTGFAVRRQSKLLVGLNGYDLHGSIQRRVSRSTTIGANYQHEHFDFPRVFGESNIDAYSIFLGTQLGRRWTLSLQAGVYQAEVQGIQQVSLDPAIAAILGIASTTQTFYAKNTLPYGGAQLSRQFKNAGFSLVYSRTIVPGNGVYLTSRSEFAGGTISYNGVRKFSLSLTAGENTLSSVGQNIQGYRMLTGGAGLTYAMTRALHVIARYDARQQQIDVAGYRRTSYRATLGIAFSPGDVPLSLW